MGVVLMRRGRRTEADRRSRLRGRWVESKSFAERVCRGAVARAGIRFTSVSPLSSTQVIDGDEQALSGGHGELGHILDCLMRTQLADVKRSEQLLRALLLFDIRWRRSCPQAILKLNMRDRLGL